LVKSKSESKVQSVGLRPALAAGLLGLGASAMALLVPADGEAAMSKSQRRDVMLRTVQVAAAYIDGDDIKGAGSGSGSILTPDGAVLTNNHVVYDFSKDKLTDLVIILTVTSFDAQPEPKCVMRSVNALRDTRYDLALVKCETDLQGKPWSQSNWAVTQVGSTRDLVPGDEMALVGFPGTGGGTMTYTVGKVSGFLAADRESAGRDWIKTDAEIGHGSSGGTAIDEDGALIGIPTQVKTDEDTSKQGERIGLVRPVEFAYPFIEKARSGWVPGQGDSGSSGSGSGFGVPKQAPPPQPEAGVTIVSTIQAADNKQPIRGALLIVLKPGVKVGDVNSDNIASMFLTKATSNANGGFVMEGPVPRGQKYSVIVIADGFEPLYEDGVLTTEGNVPDRYDPWGVITLRRK
jgi:S1-C subfamily serine protease